MKNYMNGLTETEDPKNLSVRINIKKITLRNMTGK